MKRRREPLTPADAYVAGLLACILSAEGVHLLLLTGGSLARAALVWAGLAAGALAASYAFSSLRSGRQLWKEKAMPAFALAALLQLALILSGSGALPWRLPGAGVCRIGDMTLETVKSFLATDRVYAVNPMTGAAFAEGMPLRLKALCLPTLYAFLCSLTGWEAGHVVGLLVPTAVWLGTYMAYGSLADVLGMGTKRKALFLLAVSLLLLGGSYVRGMDGFGLLYGAWRGESIRSLILIPFLIRCLLGRKWLLGAGCILCEACLVWTLYGAGWTLAVTGLMGLVWILQNRDSLKSRGLDATIFLIDQA